MNKAHLWDLLKAQLWRESQGLCVSTADWRDTPDAERARKLLDRMQTMEVFEGVHLGEGAAAVLPGYPS